MSVKTSEITVKCKRLEEIAGMFSGGNEVNIDDIISLVDEATALKLELNDRLNATLKMLEEREKEMDSQKS
jgi:hypothetical protein